MCTEILVCFAYFVVPKYILALCFVPGEIVFLYQCLYLMDL